MKTSNKKKKKQFKSFITNKKNIVIFIFLIFYFNYIITAKNLAFSSFKAIIACSQVASKNIESPSFKIISLSLMNILTVPSRI